MEINRQKRKGISKMINFMLYTIIIYFVGFYVGHIVTKQEYKKKNERRLSTSGQTVQSGSSINGEARSKTK